ncbi:MAG: type II toxin-antitoxin system mRNA interferase toxin, RelE/StbE family [Parcubacteria group bacterium]|nr:type II toxin-antitoxin system mRNA interferase toxin, RelE/StbE family [Parcubacteria group bacterium]
MEIEYSSNFKKAYRRLTLRIQKKAEQKEILFRRNCFSPQLKTHKLHGRLKEFYSFSIDEKYRIVFKLVTAHKAVFLDAGDHNVYR